jgi:ribosomal-protein-alanine N-acetyltransferase
MVSEDVDKVMEIEVIAYPHPWTKVIFRDCLKAGYQGIMATSFGDLIGYAMISVAAGEAHLLNICIDPACQGKGFGRQLLHHILEQASLGGAQTLFLEVRESNSIAQRLYLDSGFNQIGSRPGYYPDHKGREDALVFAKHLFDTQAS